MALTRVGPSALSRDQYSLPESLSSLLSAVWASMVHVTPVSFISEPSLTFVEQVIGHTTNVHLPSSVDYGGFSSKDLEAWLSGRGPR